MTQELGTELAQRTGFSRELVQELSGIKEEPQWMRERRLEAWRIYEATPMPKPTDEEWRRTDIRGLRLESLRPFADHTADMTELRQPARELAGLLADGWEKGGLLIQQDSVGVFHQLSHELAQQGVIFTSLDRAVRDHPELVREHFMTTCLPPSYGKFAALHGAFWSGGVFLYVPAGVEVTLPLCSSLSIAEPGLAAFGHTLIIADPGSSITYVQQYLSPDQEQQALHCGVMEVYLKEGAQLRSYTLQEWGSHLFDLSVQRVLLERDSTAYSLIIALGGRLAKTNVESALVGQGANAVMHGLYFGDSTQLFDFHTLQDHQGPNTTSDLLYKGALIDQARSIYAGLVRVRKGAKKSISNQTNRNILLSNKAKADSIPILEIEASDILRCSHGAATGQVDEGQLFYLMSRGLSRQEAKRMIVSGFFEPVLRNLPAGHLQEHVSFAIDRKLSQHSQGDA